MILFYHPPLGGSGAYRNSSMARRLRDRGWNPQIVTVSRWPAYFRDPTIPHIPAAHRAPVLDPTLILSPLRLMGLNRIVKSLSRWIAFPDKSLLWALLALPGALRLARRSAVLYSSSPPESCHLLGWTLKRITRKPWIADNRNEWTDNPAREDPPALLTLHRRLERKILGDADHLITLSPQHTRLLQSWVPRPERITTLWTGWDPTEAKPPGMRTPGKTAVVLFTGMFYGVKRPDPFLNAAERAGIKDIELHVLGDEFFSSERLSQSSIPVRHLGRITRAETVTRMREADFLLTTLTEKATGWVPGKIFEYAAAGRPILAVVPPDGEVAKWIRETRTGFVIPCAPVEAAAEALRDLFQQWRAGTLRFVPDAEALARYTGPAIAEELDRILRDATASR